MSETSQTMEILALIPARSGSKSVPDKNIRVLNGKPMLAHSIAHAQASTLITRTIVSTDSAAYAGIAQTYGAEVPFIRPDEFAGDLSTDLEVFTHALRWLAEHEQYRPDICVHLRPTCPIRNPRDIDAAIQCLLDHPDLDAVRSVTPSPETPFKMWFRDNDGLLMPAVTSDLPEAYNLPRQMLPQAFIQNACIDVVRSRVVLEQHSMTGTRIMGYVMNDFRDIDTEAQLQAVQRDMDAAGLDIVVGADCPPEERKTFVFDIDGVIAAIVPNNQYDQATPLMENIRVINALHEYGHTIVLFTARGTMTGLDWREVTERQLREWHVQHDRLLFGKPAADYYIDDKSVSIGALQTYCLQHCTGKQKEKK